MENANIRNVKFRGGKGKQRKFKVQLSKFQGFKVSNLRWQSNMGSINIWNVSIPNIKCRRQGEGFKKKKKCGEDFNVALWSEVCYNMLIYVIAVVSNLWQLSARWDSSILFWRSAIGLTLIDRSLVNCKVNYANFRAVHKHAWPRKKL